MSPCPLERDLDRILGIGAVMTDEDGDLQEAVVVLGDEILECDDARRFGSPETGAFNHHTLLTHRLAVSGQRTGKDRGQTRLRAIQTSSVGHCRAQALVA